MSEDITKRFITEGEWREACAAILREAMRRQDWNLVDRAASLLSKPEQSYWDMLRMLSRVDYDASMNCAKEAWKAWKEDEPDADLDEDFDEWFQCDGWECSPFPGTVIHLNMMDLNEVECDVLDDFIRSGFAEPLRKALQEEAEANAHKTTLALVQGGAS